MELNPTRDEDLRLQCLQLAANTYAMDVQTRGQDIVQVARDFYQFVITDPNEVDQ